MSGTDFTSLFSLEYAFDWGSIACALIFFILIYRSRHRVRVTPLVAFASLLFFLKLFLSYRYVDLYRLMAQPDWIICQKRLKFYHFPVIFWVECLSASSCLFFLAPYRSPLKRAIIFLLIGFICLGAYLDMSYCSLGGSQLTFPLPDLPSLSMPDLDTVNETLRESLTFPDQDTPKK